ncbi:hypothetical protein FJZ31_39620 [Candidatus Poribacteria bacterium]|nr:hypothetical protein [Candidatus Poribacteria bacterium]
MRQEIWLSDLTQCEPADVVSRDRQEGTWIAVDYEVDEGKGLMLFGLSELNPPALTLRLGVTGWHEIRPGVFYGGGAGFMEERVLCAKLSSDATFSRFSREHHRSDKDGNYPEKELRWSDIAEVFWKCADLTGQDLIISRPVRGEMSKEQTNLAYVRLVPMDETAIQHWKSQQPREDTKVLIANYDGGSFGQWGVSTPEDFLTEFECLRDSDFDIALYAMARGSITLYPSKVGEFVRPSGLHERGHVLHQCVANGLNPLAEAIKAAHACGVKLFPQNRLMGTQLPPKHLRADYGGKLMANHPEWLCTYPDGEPTRHLSFAFEGVRDFHVRLMREWVEDYHADGVNILFSRSYPFVYYEQPVCEAFQKAYQEDMRTLPPGDERVQRVRASFLTQFLREARAMLDEVGKTQGRYIPTCYLVPVHNSPPNAPAEARASGIAECLFNALDVPTWIREGLVDYLVVHLHVYGEHDGAAVQPKIREFTELAKGTKTKVFVDVYPRRMPPRQYRKIALSYYAAGADGLAFWDSYGRYFRASEWAFIKRLGHRHDLPQWEGVGDDYYRVFPIQRLDGYEMGREFSNPSDG